MGKKAKVFKPGDYVFAKVKGYPAWPAKISDTNGKKYSIYFYGTGETGNIPANDLFDYFEHKQQFMAKTLKRRDYNEGLAQIDDEVTRAGLASNDQERPPPGEEADVSGDAEPAAESDQNESGSQEAPEPEATPPPAPKQKGGRKRAADASAPQSASKARKVAVEEAPPVVETETVEEVVEEVVLQEEVDEVEEETVIETEVDQVEEAPVEEPAEEQPAPEPVKTPAARGRKPSVKASTSVQVQKTPRRAAAAKREPSPNYESNAALPEGVSRSGRKIKPKRHFEEDLGENAPTSTPPKKAKVQSASSAANGEEVPDSEPVISSPPTNTVVNNDPPKRGRKKVNKNVGKTLHFVSSSELGDLDELPAIENEGAQKDFVLPVLLPSGKLIGVKLFKDYPGSFGSSSAQLEWTAAMAKNSLRLKSELENGSINHETIANEIVMDLQLSPDELHSMKAEQEQEIKKRKIEVLGIERRMVEMGNGIRLGLTYASADMDRVINNLDELQEMDITRLMLLKQPAMVEIIDKIRHYKGNLEFWNLSEEDTEVFMEKREIMHQKAQLCFDKFKALLNIDDEQKFIPTYQELRVLLTIYSENLTKDDAAALTVEPPELLTAMQTVS